jgi:restriction endonuclease S subunit
MKALTCNESLLAVFLLFQLQFLSSQILSTVRGTTADNISSEVIKGLRLITPPIKLQKKFVQAVEKTYLQRNTAMLGHKQSDILFDALLDILLKDT